MENNLNATKLLGKVSAGFNRLWCKSPEFSDNPLEKLQVLLEKAGVLQAKVGI